LNYGSPLFTTVSELADYAQGLIMCAVCLGIIPVLQEYLGMPFEIAITIVILNGFLYLWHAHLGDPVVPGWITPAIPLLLLWLKTFPEGVPRMHALIAFEFELGLFSLFLGATGLARKFVDLVPDALKAGILLGAGVAAVRLVFEKAADSTPSPGRSPSLSALPSTSFFPTISKLYVRNIPFTNSSLT